MTSITIDSNNRFIFNRLTYYLWSEYRVEIEKQCKDYILNERIQVESRPMLFFLPRESITFLYNEQPIRIKYSVSRKPAESDGCIVRFEQFTLISDPLQNVLDFLNMVNEIVIPELDSTEISKCIWKAQDERWSPFKNVMKRKMETIYLPEKEKILEMLDSFLNDKNKTELYESLGIPSKQVFLLYGLPGTGKTSLIRALATQFDHNLAIVKNDPKIDDQSLEHMISKLPKKTFLVFEDIDCMFGQREIHSHSGITYSGVLNLLDGLSNYDKLIVFITTNFIKQLDSAFRRRVDLFVEFGYIQKPQVLEMYSRFFADRYNPDEFYSKIRGKKLTVNMLEKYFLYCLQKEKDPKDELEILEDYSSKTTDKEANLYL
jgi:hypothetical protein